MVVAGILILIGLVTLFWWVDKKSAEQDRKECEDIQEQIRHLPVEQQAQIWAAKLRHDAEKDLH